MAKEGDGILEDTLSCELTLSPTHNKMVIGSIRVLCQTSATNTYLYILPHTQPTY